MCYFLLHLYNVQYLSQMLLWEYRLLNQPDQISVPMSPHIQESTHLRHHRRITSLYCIQNPDYFSLQYLFHTHNELNSVYISVIGSDIERVSMIGLALSVFN